MIINNFKRKKKMKIGKVEFYKDKSESGGTVEILLNDKTIKNIEFIIWDSGKIELDDGYGFIYGKLYQDVIKEIENKK